MEDRQLKRPKFTEASSPTTLKRQRHENFVELQSEESESELPLLPSSDSPEKINVPSESRANSGPSASSSSVIGNNYYVFLSFRGPDTRNGFVDHLYHKLRDVGLPFHPNFVFRDDNDLPFGEDIAANLISAIKHSKVSIPVISENYAASEWCLRELIQIMECVERGEQKVLPVLYRVKPKHVRKLKSAFGDAFKSSMHLFEEDVKRRGKEALRKAVASRIFESEKFASGREGELVKELVEIITREQQHDFPPPLPVDLVGIDDRVAEVMKLVDTALSETRTIVIHGIGGIGKTTLATNIYKKLFDQFESRSFLKDIRETVNREGIKHVQSLLISDITKSYDRRVRDSETGIGMIRFSCENKKVLILLDDVDHQDHLDNLIGGCNFKLGSMIIITCRDKALLESGCRRYELRELDRKDSMLLFSKHAFVGEQPPTELKALSSDIVDTTGGLPLALKIIGSLLKGEKDEGVWRDTLEQLKNVPNQEVQKVLRISYDTLKHNAKQMFLDIACFFVGTDKRFTTYLWDDLKFFPSIGLKELINRSLIVVDDENELRMHDQLRDLGKAIAYPEDAQPWDCKRLWDERAMTIVGRKEENKNIEALRLDKNGSSMFMKRKSYKRMPYLKFLHMSEVNFVGNFKDSLSELRWLEWEMCPDSFEATNVHLEKLLLLDLSGGFISEKWGGWNSIKMEKLKVLNLSGCSHLKSTPNLSTLKSLERLILENCANLEEIDPSIGDVKCLESLNLRYCRRLKKLPAPQLGELKILEELLVDGTQIQEFHECTESLKKLKMLSAKYCGLLTQVPTQLGEVKCLVSLNLWACLKLEELPEEMCKLEELKELIIGKTAIKKIPSCIGSLKKLEILDASGCRSLDGLPDSISHLVNLLTLDLRHCYGLDKLPEDIGSLVKLQRLLLNNMKFRNEYRIPDSIGRLEWLTELDLSETGTWELPESIGDLKNLKILKIANNVNLTALPSTIHKLGKLEELDASCCERLEGEIPIDGMSSLRILDLSWTLVSGFPDAIDKLSRLEKINLTGCKELRSLSKGMSELPSLQHLKLTYCKELQSLPELPACLTVLEVTGQHHTLPRLSHLIHLKELTVERCQLLGSMPELPSGLLKLRVDHCGKLEELPSLSGLEFLSELYLKECSELTKIEGLEALKSLAKVDVLGCIKLSNLDGLEHLQSLRYLNISLDCESPLVNDELVQGLHRLKNLEELSLIFCHSLIRPNLSQLTHLKVLCTPACGNLVEIEGLERLKNLKCLDIRGCTSIETLPDLSCFDKLHTFYYGDNPKLHDIPGLERVPCLHKL